MEQALRILGDGLSIAALSIIASVSWTAWKRIRPDAQVPMQFGRDGHPTWRANRRLALLFTPVLASVIIFLPTITGVTFAVQTTQEAVILFAMRALLAGAFAAVHLLHISRVIRLLADEDQLRS